jgi:hypothetical protein
LKFFKLMIMLVIDHHFLGEMYMPTYYVNKNAQPNGDHEVHRTDNCPTPAAEPNRLYLGDFPSCHGAVQEAKKHYARSNGCAYCSPQCHTT